MAFFDSISTKVRAHAAAVSHGQPAKHMQLVLVSGTDGGQLTVACLAGVLSSQNAKVGVVTANFIEIAGERVQGSDQADVLGDPFRLHALLKQMRRAGCKYAIIEIPAQLPDHGFAGLQPTMVVMRRCGDSHLTEANNTARTALWRKIVALKPKFVVLNRDDPRYEPAGLREAASMTYGSHDKAECKIIQVEVHPKGSAITLLVDHQTELQLATELTGKTAIYSVVAAAAAAYLLHVPIAAIEDGIRDTPIAEGTLQYLPARRPYQIAVDTAITPDGIAESLETLKHFTKNRLITVVGGTLGQAPEWRPVIGEIAAKMADRLVVTDGEFTAQESGQLSRQQFLQGVEAVGADARTDEVADREAALEKALSIARRGDTIVILSSVQRPYRQLGSERHPWNDVAKIDELLN